MSDFDYEASPADFNFSDEGSEDDHTEFIVTGPKDAVLSILARFNQPSSGGDGGMMAAQMQLAQALSQSVPGLGTPDFSKKASRNSISLRANQDWDGEQQVFTGSLTIEDVDAEEIRLEVTVSGRTAKPTPPPAFDDIDAEFDGAPDEAPSAEASDASGEPKLH